MLLSRYGYHKADYDECIIDYLKSGTLDDENFSRIILALNEREKVSQIREKLLETWDIYSRSFLGTEKDFTTAMLSFLEEHATKLTLKEFSEIESIMKSLGFDVNNYRELVIQSSLDTLSLMELDVMLRSPYCPPSFNDEIKKRIEKKKNDLSISKIFAKMIIQNAWSNRDIEFLSTCSVDDYHQWLLTENDGNIVEYVSEGLRFLKMSFANLNEAETYKKIGMNIESALKKVAARSRFDKLKVENFFQITIDSINSS